MTWNNSVAVIGDITGDIYYDILQINNKPVPFLRVYMVINASGESREVKGLRIVFYGAKAELAEAYLQIGSRILVQGHLQLRKDRRNVVVVEVVSEHIYYIRNFDGGRGSQRLKELKLSGKLDQDEEVLEIPDLVEELVEEELENVE
jgi:single-stranded DNA-binding protein